MAYGDIVDFASVPDPLPEIPLEQLKKPADFRLIGKQVPRFDIPAKVDGTAKFSMDVVLPNMLYAMIARTPVHGSRPLKIENEAEIRARAGVQDIVMLDHGVGVIAESVESALAAKKSLKIQWDEGVKAASHQSTEAYTEYKEVLQKEGIGGNAMVNEGDVEKGLSDAVKVYESDYQTDYVYHAQMEPLNAVVSMAPDGKSAEVWAGTQSPASARTAAARTLGLNEKDVTLHTCYLGGGFGRRSMADYIEEAATIAKSYQQPIKLIWTREDDVQYGAFRPICLQRMKAGVDKDGNLTAWHHSIIGTGGRLLGSGARTPFYTFDHQRVDMRNIDHGIRTKHWRAVAHGPNKYAIEAFIDEVATDQSKDPLAYRLQLMRNHPRAVAVLKKVAQMADWGSAVPEGRARGLAFAERSGSLVAGVVEISLDESAGKIKVHKVWASLDAGIVVQPDNAIAQMEGGVLFGLSSVLYERITIKDGKVQEIQLPQLSLASILRCA